MPNLQGVSALWNLVKVSLPRIISVATGMAYDMFNKIVQLEINALNATVGPRYNNPKIALNTQVRTIVRMGTSHRGWMWLKYS